MSNQFDIIDKRVIQMISASDEECALIINQFLHSHIIQRDVSPVGWFSDYHSGGWQKLDICAQTYFDNDDSIPDFSTFSSL